MEPEIFANVRRRFVDGVHICEKQLGTKFEHIQKYSPINILGVRIPNKKKILKTNREIR